MRELLRDMPARLPTDSLLARIKGRRSFLARDWERLILASHPLDAIPAAPWRQNPVGSRGWALDALQKEYFWAFSRMDEKLRRSTATFFWLAELRTLSVCLRMLSGASRDLTPLLHATLLADSIRAILRDAATPAAAVTGVTTVLAGYDSRFSGAGQAWQIGGHGALEAALRDITLTRVSDPSLHPAMGRYMVLMIDCSNLTAVAKRLRWRLTTIPPLLEGGSISLQRLAGLFERRDNDGVRHLAMRIGGETRFSETAETERILYESQSRVLRRLSREPDGVGAVLDYLWRCGNEAVNINLLEHLDRSGSELAATELRQ